MKSFLDRFSIEIKRIISGFDRIILKGTFKNLNYVKGMLSFLFSQRIYFINFSEYVLNITTEFK